MNPTPIEMWKCQIWLSMHVKILQIEQLCWKSVARKFSFVCLCFDPLCWNSYIAKLISINTCTCNCLAAPEKTHQTGVQEVRGLIPSKDFCVGFLFVVVVFYFFWPKTLFVIEFCNSLSNVNLFSIINILQKSDRL